MRDGTADHVVTHRHELDVENRITVRVRRRRSFHPHIYPSARLRLIGLIGDDEGRSGAWQRARFLCARPRRSPARPRARPVASSIEIQMVAMFNRDAIMRADRKIGASIVPP
jgi:hypothetical protein